MVKNLNYHNHIQMACNHDDEHEHYEVPYSCIHRITMCDHCYNSFPQCPFNDGGVWASSEDCPWNEDPSIARGRTPKKDTSFSRASSS